MQPHGKAVQKKLKDCMKTAYELDLLRRLRNSDSWPAFDSGDFLDKLDALAERARSKGSADSLLAAALIYNMTSRGKTLGTS